MGEAIDDSEGPKPPTFIELMPPTPAPGFVVRIGAAEVEVRPGFDPELLRSIIAAIGGDV